MAIRMCLLILFATLLTGLNAAERETDVLVGALTDQRPRIHRNASQQLIRKGETVVPTVALLTDDPDATIRARAAFVLSGIGGEEAVAVLRSMVDDSDPTVREIVALGLGRHGSDTVLPDLERLVADEAIAVRDAAALGLAMLVDVQALRPLLRQRLREEQRETDTHVEELDIEHLKTTLDASIRTLVGQAVLVEDVAELMRRAEGQPLQWLIEATWQAADPRYAPVLEHLLQHVDAEVRWRAAMAAGANGDSRLLGTLVVAASDDPDLRVRERAAASLRTLTGHEAGPGRSWVVWWRQHRDQVSALHQRDAFLAQLHDPRLDPEQETLRAFSPAQLEGLVEGARGAGASYWPRLAWRAIRVDGPERWVPYLRQRYQHSADPVARVAYITMLDALQGSALHPLWRRQLDQARGSERALLQALLGRW